MLRCVNLYDVDSDFECRIISELKLCPLCATQQSRMNLVVFNPTSCPRLKIRAPVCILPLGSVNVRAKTISGLKGAEFRVDTLEDIPKDIPLGRQCFVALIFTKKPDESQALVFVTHDDGTYCRCGLVCLPDQSLQRFTKCMEIDNISFKAWHSVGQQLAFLPGVETHGK